MAKFEMELPEEIMKDFRKIYDDADEIFGRMTRAGAEVVYKNVIANMKNSFKDSSKLEPYLKITDTYKTYTGRTINTKIAFYGYYKKGKGNYVNRQNRMATEAFTYKTGGKHRATRIGGRKEKNYEYIQEGVPVPLIVMAREFGTSRGEKKKPFFRKSFKESEIRKAMLEEQTRASGGILQ